MLNMFILPFIHSTTTVGTKEITCIQILTIGGKTLWTEEDGLHIITDILEPNGLYVKSPPITREGIIFCPIDPIKTVLHDFYIWDDLPIDDQETFCWRRWYLLVNQLPISPTEQLAPFSVQQIMELILSLNHICDQ